MSAPADPNRARTLIGELRDTATGELYAATIKVTTAAPARLPDAGVSVPNVTVAANVVATVEAKPLGREAAWDGTNRI